MQWWLLYVLVCTFVTASPCGEQTGEMVQWGKKMTKDGAMGENHFKFILLLSVWYCLLLKMSFQAWWTLVPTKYIHRCVLVAPLLVRFKRDYLFFLWATTYSNTKCQSEDCLIISILFWILKMLWETFSPHMMNSWIYRLQCQTGPLVSFTG